MDKEERDRKIKELMQLLYTGEPITLEFTPAKDQTEGEINEFINAIDQISRHTGSKVTLVHKRDLTS